MSGLKEQIRYEDFAKLDLRVATIVEAEPHPNADRLLKLQIDLGELGRRQICAGIRQYYEPGELVGRQIVVVANLEPRKIRGECSEGMLLAASHLEAPAPAGEQGPEGPEGAAPAGPGQEPTLVDVVLLRLDRPVPPGSTIS